MDDTASPPPQPGADALYRRIAARSATIGVIGLGYVGLPLVIALAEKGFAVTGFDIDGAKIDALERGQSYFRHIPEASIAALRARGHFAPTADFARLAAMDAIIVCVPTPLTAHREPDLGSVIGTAETIARTLRPGQLVILESTSYPGTTDETVRPILERNGLKSGADFFLAFSPEREDPGNADFATRSIPKIVGGDGDTALHLATALYGQITTAVPVRNNPTAEAVKLTENIFRAVNIALVNELKQIYGAMGIDIWEVIEAAKTKPFGYMPFYPGPGLGGHCIPIDPFYLTWKAREFGVPTRFIELAGEINTRMPVLVVEATVAALSERFKKSINGAHILIVGIAYKKNVDDTRESPAFRLMEIFEARGASVDFHDPFIPEIPRLREYPSYRGRKSAPLDAATLEHIDAAVICTDHDGIDYRALAATCRLVIDTRNACAKAGAALAHVVKA